MQSFVNCYIKLGDSSIKILSSGSNITLFDNCTITSDTKGNAIDGATDHLTIKGSTIQVSNGCFLTASSGHPVVELYNCKIDCDKLFDFRNYSKLIVRNNQISCYLFADKYLSPQMIQFLFSNNNITTQSSLVLPFAQICKIENNCIFHKNFDNSRLVGVDGYNSSSLCYTGVQFKNSKISIEHNQFYNIPNEMNVLFSCRHNSLSHKKMVVSIIGNALYSEIKRSDFKLQNIECIQDLSLKNNSYNGVEIDN